MTDFNWVVRDRNVAGLVSSSPILGGVCTVYWGGDTEVSSFPWDPLTFPNLQILTIDFGLSTSLNVGTRRPRVVVQQPNGGALFSFPAMNSMLANQVRSYHFGADMMLEAGAVASTSIRQVLPEGLILLGAGLTNNGYLQVTIDGIRSGDLFTNLAITGRLVA